MVRVKKRKVQLLLDSGAYSAWSRNETLDVKQYIKFCKDNASSIWQPVALDVIPGKLGSRIVTQEGVEKSAQASYRNFKIMQDAGVQSVPVFHQGEDWKWLERYLHEGVPYVGIASLKALRQDEQMDWLDQCFARITDKNGIPCVKTHGFGLTGFPFLTNYPWYTVDSTTWSLTPGYGQIIVPVFKDGKPDYLATPMRVAISGVTHTSPSSQKRQFENLKPKEQEVVEYWLHNYVKTTVAEARYGTQVRRRAMLIYYIGLCDAIKGVTFSGRRGSIIKERHYDLSNLKALKPFNLIMMYATAMNREWSWLMTSVGANTRLLSYYELRNKPPEVLAEYVERGIEGEYKPGPVKVNWKSETYLNRRRLNLWSRHVEYQQLGDDDAANGVGGEA